MTGALVTLLALSLTAVPAVLVPALLGIRGRAPFAVAALLVAAAAVVGCTIALSVPRWLTVPGMLGALALVAAASVLLWRRRGRPAPPRIRNRLVAAEPLGGAAIAMLVVAGLALLIQFYVGMRVAPGNWDSMTYHLSRAAYWLQEQGAFHYPGGSVRQLGSAPNAEILLAWTMLVNATDRWVELVQWISLIGLGVTIFCGARLLRFPRGAAAFAGGLFVVLPQPIMQSASTQNDIVASFFIAAATFFVARGLRDRSLGDLTMAAVGAGLAIGTKGTALIALPSLAIVCAGALIAWRPPLRIVGLGLALGVAGIAAFGSYNYALNYDNTGDIFGGVQEQVSTPGGDRWNNAARDLWTFAETPGMNVEWATPLVQRPMDAIFGGVYGEGYPYAIDVGVQEDTVAYGLVGFLILVPLLLVMLVGPRSTPARRILALSVIAYLLFFSYRIDENPWLGRLYMPAVALAAPLFASLGKRSWTAGAVGALAVLSLVPSLLVNPQKRILVPPGEGNVFTATRLQQMANVRPEMQAIAEQVFRFSPGKRIGYFGGEDSWDYPLFGPHRDRYIKRMTSPNDTTYANMAKLRLDGIVFANSGVPPAPLEYSQMGNDYYWVPARTPR